MDKTQVVAANLDFFNEIIVCTFSEYLPALG